MAGSIKTWDQAQEFCKHRGGELVKINSFEENEFVLKLVNQCDPPLKQVWIGLRWKPYAKTFLWSDNSIPFFKYWAPHEPNGKASEPLRPHVHGAQGPDLSSVGFLEWSPLWRRTPSSQWSCLQEAAHGMLLIADKETTLTRSKPKLVDGISLL